MMTAKKGAVGLLIGLAIMRSAVCANEVVELEITPYEPFWFDEYVEPVISEEAAWIDPYTAPYDLSEMYGMNKIEFGSVSLQMYDLPDKYYPGIDYNSMQPYMSYKMVTSKGTESYRICHNENAYTDNNGYRRYKTDDNVFTVNDQDDYVIALGNFYKEKDICGQRYLIVTTTGSYTAIVGDEKADCDTDKLGMVHDHGNGKYSLIEWIVDPSSLEQSVKRGGSIRYSSNDTITGDILYIYRIY